MTIDEAKDYIREWCPYDRQEEIIEALSNSDEDCKWIPVSERLPEKTGLYLVSGKWRDKPPKVWVAGFSDIFGLRGWENNAKNPTVEFWMPLSKSPYEE